MRNLIFVDNDSEDRAKKDVEHYILNLLEEAGIEDPQVEIIGQFYRSDRTDEMYNKMLSKENAIITWSVYTPTAAHDSRSQILRYLRTAGSHDLKDLIYIDASGMFNNYVGRWIDRDETKGLFDILRAIERNYILTVAEDNYGVFSRLRVDFAGKKPLREESINLKELLEKSS